MAAARQILVASGAQTGAGNSVGMPVSTGTMMAVEVDITAGSGTPTFNLWMEGSVDGGTTWFRLLADLISSDINGAASDVTTARTNIVSGSASTTIDRHGAIYKHLPCDMVRARWTMTGGTPSRTFSVNVGVK